MKSINLEKFISMMSAGTKSIAIEYKYINELNIFPVPDGDTGSNMKMTTSDTFNSVEENIENIKSLKDFANSYVNKILFNARGNSGVIFSQIISGFLEEINEDQKELTCEDLVRCFKNAKAKGYKSVYNPIEGTILTVIRYIAEYVEKNKYDDVEQLFSNVIKIGNEALESTKNMIEELKKANVVDSGGYGLMSFFRGMNASLSDKLVDYLESIKMDNEKLIDENSAFKKPIEHEEIEFGYCSEFILEINGSINPNLISIKKNFNLEMFKKQLSKLGTSIVVVQQNNLVKLHIHTTTPDKVLNLGRKFGEFSTIKIENMTCQFMSKMKDKVININDLENKIELVYTVPSNQIASWFVESYNQKNYIICEPSSPTVETFLNKFKMCRAKEIICIVHDSNLALVAQSAIKQLEDKINIQLIVVGNILDTYNGLENYDPKNKLKDNINNINNSIQSITTGLISTAVKDTDVDGLLIRSGDKILIHKKKIIASGRNFDEIIVKAMKSLRKNEEAYLCYLIGGKNITQNSLENLYENILNKYGIFCETLLGNQEVYDLIIGIK